MHTVLVVDPDQKSRAVSEAVLQRVGCRVRVFNSTTEVGELDGVEAVVWTPDRGDLEAVEGLLALQTRQGKPLPVIVASRSLHQGDLLERMPIELWIAACQTSPFDPDDVVSLLHHLLPKGLGGQWVQALPHARRLGGGAAARLGRSPWDLQAGVLLPLMCEAALRSITGRLDLHVSGGGNQRFWLEAGMVVATESDGHDEGLLRRLARSGVITSAQAEPSFKVDGLKNQIGYARSLGASVEDIDSAFLGGMVEALAAGLLRPQGKLSFRPGTTPPRRHTRSWPVLSVAYRAFLSFVGRADRPKLTEGARLRGAPPAYLDEHDLGLSGFHLAVARRALQVGPLGGTVGDFVRSQPGAAGRSERIHETLRYLAALGVLRLDEPHSYRGEVLQQYPLYAALMSCVGDTHYEVLGLPSEASQEQVHKRWIELSKKFHPDGFFGRAPRTLRLVGEIQARAAEAYQAIEGGEESAKKTESDDEQIAQDPVRAKLVMHLGDQALRTRRYAVAAGHFKEAVGRDPESSRAVTYAAWAGYLAFPTRRQEFYEDLMRSVRAHPRYAPGYLLAGRMLKLKGDEVQAAKAFGKAIRIKPDFVDAQRELRVLERRLGNSSSSPSASVSDPSAEGPEESGLRKLLKKKLF